LLIAATNSWAVCFDNLSHLPDWLSDALCRLATGGGFSTRELYTDAEEKIFDAMRPTVLTSIEDLAARGDLLERSIVVRLPRIPERSRRTERAFWKAFDAARPRVLGALLTVVSGALRALDSVCLAQLPRMADFALWATAAETALEWKTGTFESAYSGNRRDANELALDASPLTGPLRELVGQHELWSGSATDLLARLAEFAGEKATKEKDWPKKPHVLSGRLRRLAPNLAQTGIGVEFERKPKQSRDRTVIVWRSENWRNEASEASEATQNPQKTSLFADASDATGPYGERFPGRSESVKTPEKDALDASDAPMQDFSDEREV
jgi:hypothetical protein